MPSLNHQNCCRGTPGCSKRQNGNRAIAMMVQGLHGRWMEVQWSLQWSLNGRYWPKEAHWRYRGGRGIAQIERNVYSSTHFYGATIGLPLCIHFATMALRVPTPCLVWATCAQLSSSVTFVWLFWRSSKLNGNYGVHGEVWTSCAPPLNDQGKLSAPVVHPMPTSPVYDRTKEAQRSQCLCKVGINKILLSDLCCWTQNHAMAPIASNWLTNVFMLLPCH